MAQLFDVELQRAVKAPVLRGELRHVVRVDRFVSLSDGMVQHESGQVDEVLVVDLVDLELAEEQVGWAGTRTVVREPSSHVDDVRHADHVDEDVDLLSVLGVEEVEAAVALHRVEAVVGLVADGRKESQHRLTVPGRDHIIEVAVLAAKRWVLCARGVQVDAGPAQELDAQALRSCSGRDSLRLGDGVFQGPGGCPIGAQSGAISITIVFRSLICSRAKRPPTRPMPLFLPARPPKGRCASP